MYIVSKWKVEAGSWHCVCGVPKTVLLDSLSWEYSHAFLKMIKYNEDHFSPSRSLSLPSKPTVAVPLLIPPFSLENDWHSFPQALQGLWSSGWGLHASQRSQGRHALAASPSVLVEGGSQGIPSVSSLTPLPSAGTQCPSCPYLHVQQEMLCKQNCSQSFNCYRSVASLDYRALLSTLETRFQLWWQLKSVLREGHTLYCNNSRRKKMLQETTGQVKENFWLPDFTEV